MSVLKFITVFFLAYGGLFSLANAESDYIVDHADKVIIDPQLNMSDLINKTLEKYPDSAVLAAMYQESEALNERGSRWVAGAANISLNYKDDFAGSDVGAYEFEGMVEVPVWNWGQRDAGFQLGVQAKQSVERQVQAIKLKVAGLVRAALWNIKLEESRYDMTKLAYYLTEKLFKTVQRRVQLGDLAQTDFLLAQSEFLQKKIELIQAEAELMHARKRFYFLTQDNKMPLLYEETQSTETEIKLSHPALAAVNAIIEQKKFQVDWIKAQGSGQTTLAIGGVSERGNREDSATDSIAFGITVPFGGNAYLAPEIAAANKDYVQAEISKAHLYRKLSEELHEAEHALEIERANLDIAGKMHSNAQKHLRIADLSFNAGEINLMDFLRVQERSQLAISNARESAIRLQRDIAFYNQAVGVMP